jgi:cytoskeleton protein RodZ
MTLHLRPSNGEDATDTSFRVKPDAVVDPAGEAGWYLQRERERRGKTLADAALETRINAKYLHAIEHGVLHELPNRSYMLGYIRVYAEFLGLEADPLVEHFKALLPVADAHGKSSAKGGASSLLGLTAATAVFIIGLTAAVWYMAPDLFGDGQQTADLDAAQRTSTANAEPGADALPTGSIPTDGDAGPADLEAQRLDDALPTVRVQQRGFSDADEEQALSQSAETLQPQDKAPLTENAPQGGEETDGLTEFIRQHVSEAQSSEEMTAQPLEGKTYGADSASARVVLTAKQPVWIRVEDSSGNVIITRTLAAGDAYRVPDRKGLVLIARDGGALDYSIDGQPKGAIGASGEIVVGRSLNIDELG